MEKKKKKHSVMNNVLYLFRAIAATYPLLMVFIFMEMVLSVVSPVFGIYLPSLAVRLVTKQADRTAILLKLGGLGLLWAAAAGLGQMAAEGKYYMYNSMRVYFQFRLFFHSLHCDYIHVESKEGQNRYQRAMDTLFNGDWSGTSRMLVAVISMISGVLCFVIYSGILTTLHPLLVLFMVLLSWLHLLAVKAAQNYEYQRKDKAAGLNQKLDYVEWTARDARYGKDIRLYQMDRWFVDMRNTLTDAYCKLKNQIQNRYFAASGLNTFLQLLRDIFIYGYLILQVFGGKIGISEFVLYFGAVTGFAGFIQNISEQYNVLKEANLQMNDMRSFLETTEEPEPEAPAKLPIGDAVSIDFDHVWFSYDPGEEPVLKNFSLHVEAGEKIALVGENGAGKTTFIKLLCGFYRPDKGEIRINGINIRRFCKEDLYRLFSAVFQDLYIAPHTVAENVSLQPEKETDLKRVESCLKKAGLWEVIRSYPRTVHTYMGKAVHDGIQLSGGQQQKLLMARALYKDAPVMILDEPTAALDPIAESETYENFHKLTGAKTVIYISHRLASTRFCHRILFLKDGKIRENGTHEELMQQAGEYAHMFEVQSHYYRKEEAAYENQKTTEQYF